MRVIVGVDLGGTNIVVGAVREDGHRLCGLLKRPTPTSGGPDVAVDQIADMIGTCIDRTRVEHPDAEVLGVGLGAPGPLDTERGIVVTTPNLGWRNMPLRQRIMDATGLPAALENDATCAILGETWRGAAQGKRVVVGLTIGTGVGGGIILDGKVFHGASDVAGEVGHMTIDITGRRCNCGNYGCLEAYASGTAIAARAIEGIESGAESSLREQVEGDLSRITAHTVYEAASRGDDLALEVVQDTARFLGVGIASLINIFNPETVVICGGVTSAGEWLFRPLRKEVMRRAFEPAVRVCRIVAGTLPGTAGVYGAAAAFKAQTGAKT